MDGLRKFIIDVGEFLELTTPYSDNSSQYESIKELLYDLDYCLELEVNRNVKAENEQKKG